MSFDKLYNNYSELLGTIWKDPKDSEKSKTDYILICDNFSDGIINSTVCSNNSTFKVVPLENKNER